MVGQQSKYNNYSFFQVGKDRHLGYDPCCLSFFSKGEYLVIGGSDKKVSQSEINNAMNINMFPCPQKKGIFPYIASCPFPLARVVAAEDGKGGVFAGV